MPTVQPAAVGLVRGLCQWVGRAITTRFRGHSRIRPVVVVVGVVVCHQPSVPPSLRPSVCSSVRRYVRQRKVKSNRGEDWFEKVNVSTLRNPSAPS